MYDDYYRITNRRIRRSMDTRELMPTVVMVDLDSTVCDTRHRHHLSVTRDPKSTWEAYSEACIDDEPIRGTVTLLRLLYPHHRIVLCSGRNHTAYENTEIWLSANDVPYDELFLCNYSETNLSNGEYKVLQIERQRQRGYHVVLFLEDWPESAEMIEKVGVPVLCVNPRYQGTHGLVGPGEAYLL